MSDKLKERIISMTHGVSEIAGGIITFVTFGFLADRKYNTGNKYTIFGAIIGFVVAANNLRRVLIREKKRLNGGDLKQ